MVMTTQTSNAYGLSSCSHSQRQRASSEKSSLHLIRPSAFLARASLLACITSTAPGAANHTVHCSLWGRSHTGRRKLVGGLLQ